MTNAETGLTRPSAAEKRAVGSPALFEEMTDFALRSQVADRVAKRHLGHISADLVHSQQVRQLMMEAMEDYRRELPVAPTAIPDSIVPDEDAWRG